MNDIDCKNLDWDAKRSAWGKIIEDFNKSDQNQSRYCRENGINKVQFSYYLRRWRKANSNSEPEKVEKISFLPVEISKPKAPWILKIAHGVCLEMPENVPMDQLSSLILNLREKLC